MTNFPSRHFRFRPRKIRIVSVGKSTWDRWRRKNPSRYRCRLVLSLEELHLRWMFRALLRHVIADGRVLSRTEQIE
jgi:hypothetical protein